MPESLRPYLETLRDIDIRGVVDILSLTLIIWWVLALLRGTTAMSLLRGGAIVLVGVFAIANVFDLLVLDWLLRHSLTGLLLAVPIVFQPEIRRALERVGRTSLATIRGRPAYDGVIDAIALAGTDMARRRHGALMVLERETGLEDYISTGRRLDAEPSEELIEGIFYRNSPLHDGAVILRGDRLVAAACTLPLSDAPLPPQYGTRHRAALGITERTDAVSIVVSEETGEISVAADGRLTPNLTEAELRTTLKHLLSPAPAVGINGYPERRNGKSEEHRDSSRGAT